MRITLGFALLLAAACGSSSSSFDAATTSDMAVLVSDGGKPSRCGQPGDTGNSLGVGKYCSSIADCAGNTGATICSSLLNTGGPDDTYFCTKQCDPAMGDAQCGENARCQCMAGAGCGCSHDRCGVVGGG